MISFNTPVKYMDTTPDMYLDKIYTYLKVRTNSDKQTIAYTATILLDNIPTDLKDLNTFNFMKHLKLYLLSEQH